MKIKFYVINQNNEIYSCFVTNKSELNNFEVGRKSSKCFAKETFTINPYCFYIFLNEIQCCQFYRHSLAKFIKSLPNYVIKLEPPKKEFIDKVW
jgi:hypothetical protein